MALMALMALSALFRLPPIRPIFAFHRKRVSHAHRPLYASPRQDASRAWPPPRSFVVVVVLPYPYYKQFFSEREREKPMLTELTNRIVQILTSHKDLIWNQPPDKRVKMAPELRILAELFKEISQRQNWSPKLRPQTLQSTLLAANFIATHGGVPVDEVLNNTVALERAFRAAAKKMHPDAPGGDVQQFRELMAHREILRSLEGF